MKVAVIGLGTMGAPMAANLINAGVEVTVHNRTRSREEPLEAQGAWRAASPREAAGKADVVLICVSDTDDVAEVLAGSDGALAGLARGGLVVDCSTISPEGARDLARKAEDKEIGFVDAPVSGGSEGAIHGTLAIMCGGTEVDFERALPVLEIIGGKVTHVGPVGCGQIAKAVNQVIIAGTYQSLAEGIALAFRAGADPRRVIAAINSGAAASWILDNRAENMVRDEYPLGFRVRLHRKDLGIALDTGRAAELPLPTAAYVAGMEDALIAQGHGDEDVSAIARVVRRAAAISDGPME